jgi:hypothetical protein
VSGAVLHRIFARAAQLKPRACPKTRVDGSISFGLTFGVQRRLGHFHNRQASDLLVRQHPKLDTLQIPPSSHLFEMQ